MSPFNVGDLVMFKNRCQPSAGGMPVEAVDSNMFDTKIKVAGQWWSPTAFVSHEGWLQAQREGKRC